MAAYSLEQFVEDLDAITGKESDPAVITAKVAPLLSRLCRNPDPRPPAFWQDTQAIAARFGLDAAVLAEAIRYGQSLMQLRRAAETP